MSTLSTHVLDTSLGRPAEGVLIRLEAEATPGATGGAFTVLGRARTDGDGRVRELLPQGHTLHPGLYRLTFSTGAYFQARGTESFYPEVVVTFRIQTPNEHYHVPLLLSPYGFSTYRGS